MPKMDGYTFIMKKSADPAIAKIPVIVLSAQGKTEPLFKRHGVKAYLLKPLNPQDLLNKVQAVIPIKFDPRGRKIFIADYSSWKNLPSDHIPIISGLIR